MNTSYPHIEPWPISFPAPPGVYMNLISRSIKQELEKREGRETADGAPAAFGYDLEQAVPAGARDGVGDGRGEARDQRLAEEVVARDEVDPHAPYINPKKIEEPRKLGADLPVLKPATPTPTPTPAPPAPVAPVPPPVEAGPRRMARAPRQQLGSK